MLGHTCLSPTTTLGYHQTETRFSVRMIASGVVLRKTISEIPTDILADGLSWLRHVVSSKGFEINKITFEDPSFNPVWISLLDILYLILWYFWYYYCRTSLFLSHVTAMSAKNATGPGASKQTSIIIFLTFSNIFLECPQTSILLTNFLVDNPFKILLSDISRGWVYFLYNIQLSSRSVFEFWIECRVVSCKNNNRNTQKAKQKNEKIPTVIWRRFKKTFRKIREWKHETFDLHMDKCLSVMGQVSFGLFWETLKRNSGY